jgi:hypothetical protein
MTEKEGVLRMQPSGRWAVCRLGRKSREIASGEPFRVEVNGVKELQLTRMEFRNLRRGGGEYFSVDDYPLCDGLRAAVGDQE